jgi:carbon monoxide dehydrogenase subunit G
MNTFLSKSVNISSTADKVYSFLSDFNNFGMLMPPENTNWESNSNSCNFTISKMADLSMTFGNGTPNKMVVMKANGNNPFDYLLEVHINKSDHENCQVHIAFHAELSPMIAMVATTPLNNFVNLLVDKLKEKLDN